ncbi:CLUMA_CG007021, isoform A [Clunio marinus]|uniref:CLUMA_CG007021, isoform A n=1 Tax=Clunio marinus TaxID=568069 RepID=A0A1J1HZN5_9DIPT|nr:CLUMA_CG007021, isoform A [Clunio marinus]
MSVCVSSSLSGGMTHASHLHLTSTLSMMQQSFQSHHPMAPSAVLNSNLEMSQTQSSTQLQTSSSSSSSDINEPNQEMLLALIARNKTLEGEFRLF